MPVLYIWLKLQGVKHLLKMVFLLPLRPQLHLARWTPRSQGFPNVENVDLRIILFVRKVICNIPCDIRSGIP